MGDDSLLLQLGVGGIFAYIIIKEVLTLVFKFMAKKKNGCATSAPGTLGAPSVISDLFGLLRDTKAAVDELHKWHDVRDEDQVPVWYVRKSLERLVGELAKNVEALTRAIEKQTDVLEGLSEEPR